MARVTLQLAPFVNYFARFVGHLARHSHSWRLESYWRAFYGDGTLCEPCCGSFTQLARPLSHIARYERGWGE